MVNEWTSNDVPSVSSLHLYNKRPDLDICGKRFGAAAALEAVVQHLNAHYPKPENPEQLLRMCNAAQERADQLRDERDDVVQSCITVGRDRDRWRARAEAAARAIEAAEARTAPTVTRDDIEKAIRGKVWAANRDPNKAGFHRVHIAWATDSVWSLVSGADPVVYVVRESDLPEVERDEDGDWLCENLAVNRRDTAEDLRGRALAQLKHVAMREAVARAIEAGQAADPVEELAGQIESATREAIRQVCVDLADVAPSLDSLAVERAMEVTAASRKVAAHVLGQEVK